MSDSRIAVRYAKPLLSLAQEQGKLDIVKDDMEAFLKICDADRNFVLMLKSPVIPHTKKAKILDLIFKGKFDKLTISIFELLSKKNREYLLQSVASEFLRLYNVLKGIEVAKVVTAVPLGDKLKKHFIKTIEEITSKSVLLKEEINPALIGGFVLTIGDRRIDDSVSGKLRLLKQELIKN
jgi:F-type H+-transporting ATPase subunit delta